VPVRTRQRPAACRRHPLTVPPTHHSRGSSAGSAIRPACRAVPQADTSSLLATRHSSGGHVTMPPMPGPGPVAARRVLLHPDDGRMRRVPPGVFVLVHRALAVAAGSRMGDGPRGGGACASSRMEATRHPPAKGQRASPGPAGVGNRPGWAAPRRLVDRVDRPCIYLRSRKGHGRGSAEASRTMRPRRDASMNHSTQRAVGTSSGWGRGGS
jgi:hypothetical protein